jgi:ribosome-binding factor A
MDGRRRRGPQRPYPRVARVNALLVEILAEALERLADSDERLRLLTVTGVKCEPGFSQAVVYLDSLTEDGSQALSDHRKALQALIARQVHLRRTPLLSFTADPAIAAGAAVEAALRRAKPIPERADSESDEDEREPDEALVEDDS